MLALGGGEDPPVCTVSAVKPRWLVAQHATQTQRKETSTSRAIVIRQWAVNNGGWESWAAREVD